MGGTGGGGWEGANSMAASGLVFRSDLVGTGRAISILFGINGVRNQRSHLVGPPFPEFKANFLRKVQYWQLIGIPRPISSYCFYKDICPSPNLYPNLLQLPILHLYAFFSYGRLAFLKRLN